ncbi:uncharacterized protein [Venturia canescens]|uniref:uncharacterized protein isoform X2 n=1 Tax=Venturia canescens TaxID=32260 RepID=UPI001C9BE74F|nr:uncharacterized protein LOC122419205 isoform X2 [Venturia canescens]
MDEYERKFAEMQKYIPFLEAMIERLKKAKDQSRASQLQKLQSLHGILSDSKRKLKLDTLQRCEDVLQKLHSKVEKGNPSIPKAQSTKNTESAKPDVSGLIQPKIECTTTDYKSIEDNEMKNKIAFVKKMEDDETPASPSPPASPDQMPDSTNVKPIIIPTERSDGFTDGRSDDRPASPDACEMIASIGPRAPIIIPTERETPNPLRNIDPEASNQRIPTWTYPDSIPNRVTPTTNLWQSNSAPRGTGARPRVIRHIPTVPIPSKSCGGVLKKPVLVLDKGRSSPTGLESPVSKFDAPSTVDARLHSPDRDAHLPRAAVKTSPKTKDLPPIPKLPTTSLLASPPPVLTIPPLTSEDLAELLQDESEKQDNRKSEISSKPSDTRKTSIEGGKNEARKPEKDTDGKSSARAASGSSKKDENSSKNSGPTAMDVDQEAECRWEEIDRPIVKLLNHETSRRTFASSSGPSTKHGESRASSSSSSTSMDRPTDPRNRGSSPSRDRHNPSSEVRYADNYEKHPRQSRDNYKSGSQSDLNTMNSAFSRNSEVESRSASEERSSALYHRRSYSTNGPSYQELDPRREKSVEFYKNIVQRELEREREREQEKQREREREIQRERERELQRERERDIQRERDIEREILNQGSGRGMNHHSPGRGGEMCNQNQWGPNVNYPQGPNMYPQQQQQRPDRWMQGGPNNLPVEPHMMVEPGGHMRQQQYQGPPNSCGRPMLSPQDMNMGGPCMDRNMGPCMDMNIGPRMDQACMDMNMGPRMDPGCGDMNIGPCMDPGFRDDMSNPNMGPQAMAHQQHPNAMPGMIPPQGYPMGGSQYHQFPQENRGNVQQFDRPQDFPHPRQSWDQSNSRPNDNVQYPRSQGPSGPPQGPWNRANRGGAVGVGPQAVQPPLMTPPLVQAAPPAQGNRNYNERARGPETSRNSYNRDPRDSRDHRDSRDPRDPREPRDSRDPRDPRMRAEGSTNLQNTNVPASGGPPANSRREFNRFSKDSSQGFSHSAKPRDNSSSSDRNPRRRTNDSKDSNKNSAPKEKEPEREQSRKREEKKRDPKNDKKNDNESGNKDTEKSSKDVMQSPLESLYGVVDTTAKTGKGYGLQHFRIPKKPKPQQSPPKATAEVPVDEHWDAPGDHQDGLNTNDKHSEITEIPRGARRKEADDKKSEVTSTTGESSDDPQIIGDSNNASSKETLPRPRGSHKSAKKLPESEQIVDTSTQNVDHSSAARPKESEAPKLKDEVVTQELIQALIRKSLLESGDVVELFESKFMQRVGEAIQKKGFKKFLNIIDSDSSSTSDKEKSSENKKSITKKKRRVILSDSSEDECLAERLDKIDTADNDATSVKTSQVKGSIKEKGKKNSAKENVEKNLDGNSTTNETVESEKDGTNDTQDLSNQTGKIARRQRRHQRRKAKAASVAQETAQASEPVVADTKEQQTNEKLDEPPKTQSGKPKPRRRNSLEMLQEDIREMFISEGVMTATGHRMCRLIKEAQENLTSTAESQGKKGSSGSLDRQSARNESDAEDEIQRPNSVNSRARRGRGNGRRRQRCRTKIQKSVKEIPSSDSETEDSIKTEISVPNESNENNDKTGDASSKADNNSKSSKEDTDASHFLRRSERVGLRDSTKGQKSQGKSDANKMESSKMMFDCSSDESFGIDVSELTAAVDISLHSESRGRITSSPVAKGSSNVKSKKQKAGKAKEEGAGRNEKSENVASADEVESIASDLSRASSLTRGKKANSSGPKQDRNDELMSDLLTGLVDSKIPGNKSVDGDTENENTMNSQEAKNTGRRRKKKKASWALGIVKKKKKKIPSPTSTPSIEAEISNADGSPHDTSFDNTNEVNVKMKEEILSDSSPTKCTAGGIPDAETKGPRAVRKLEPLSPQKSISSVNNSLTNFDDTSEGEKQLDELLMDDRVDDESDTPIQAKPKIFSTEELLKYIWLPKQDRFSCLYCSWNGKNIVHHYALNHGTQETLISRLSIEQSKTAKEESASGDYEKREPNPVTTETRKFLCRFCAFQTVGSPAIAIEAFYEHCTTHTGEYRFRCRTCTYRTVARSSMRTHCSRRRNNPCRVDYANTSMAFVEDPIPDDDFLRGYMCAACNFVQLKESNVVDHVKLQHATSPDTEILKIDMSSHVEDDLDCDIGSEDTKPELKLEDDLKAEVEVDNVEAPELDSSSLPLTVVTGTVTGSIEIDEETFKNETLKEEDVADAAKSTNGASEAETVTAQETVTGNLNAFVCPPELENKEFEIQLERRKKMQEIVDNIGLSSNLNEKRDLSILEKLKEKMTENLSKDAEEGEAEEQETPDKSDVPSEETPAVSLPVLLPDSVTSLAPEAESGEQIEKESDDSIKKEAEEPVGGLPRASKDEIESETEDKSEKKLKDPLANLEGGHRDDSSENDDDSDVENIGEQPPQSYDSDSSTEQSDTEIPADVNSLLEETFSINTTSNAPMMTTIQRLAAKLQSEKPFVAPPGNPTSEHAAENTEQQETSDGIIPKKPNAIPISSIQRFLDRRNAVLQEVVKELSDINDKDSKLAVPPSPSKSPVASAPVIVSSPPKKFIRLRRLSGDKLSVPGPAETSAVITPVAVSRASSLDSNTSEGVGEVLPLDTEEECSFLRIENVVSLAPGIENNPQETTVDDIRIAVANTTLKSSNPISLLRKNTSNFLKRPAPGSTNLGSGNLPLRPVGTIPIANLQVKPTSGLQSTYIPIRPAPTPAIGVPIKPSGSMPTSSSPGRPALAVPIPNAAARPTAVPVPVGVPVSSSGNKNFKIVKVVRGLTLLKQKDSTHRNFGIKMKSIEAFNTMLQPEKLRQFYKCMARSCTFSTDCQQSFGLHYRQHKENVDRTKGVMSTYDFQRCAYCTETLTTWNAMSEHLKDKHIYCQYQCHHCFYRAIAQSYVELHHITVHPSTPVQVLLGQRENPPIEVIDRREFVIPFVCHHECGKSFYVPGAFLGHLRTKHGNSLSIFKCHLCPAPSFKAETLVAHYKLHGIYKYQCLYCLFGSEQASDVHAHLSASHYNRPPHVLERTLQPRPVRDKDVIQQLIVHNVDESYKCSELTILPGQEPVEAPQNRSWLQVDRNLSNDNSSVVGEITLPIGNIGMSRLFSYDKLDSTEPATSPRVSTPPSSNAVPVITKIRKVSPTKSAENVLTVGDNSVIKKVPKKENSSPEKSVPASSSSSSSSSSSADAVTITPSSASASNSNHQVDRKPIFVAVKDETSAPMKAETPASAETPTDPQPFDICSSNENSLDANTGTNQSSTETEDTSGRPMTLEDIRDTGFTGSQLYICGYDGCEYGAETSAELRTHIKECFYASETKSLNCVHCNKRFMKIGFLVEHFKLHGLKRFGCSMCKGRWPMPYQAMSHMKSKHKQTYTKLIPADPKNPSAEGLYIVEPIPTNGTCRKQKRGRVKSSDKDDNKSDIEKTYYGPTDIESLPRQAIYGREVHCAVCPYTTKVRTNILRHLQLHAEDKSVPESGPVNPVPCLDKKERMFDKMVNLASSSHQNGRMSTKTSKEPKVDNDAEFLPKFIPENRRYVCGVTDCNYVSLNETMLRCHLKALHSDEIYFRCPHCPAPAPGHETQNVAIDKMAVHLKMHDSRLYKCSHCNNHHFHRHVVERHLSDKHPDVNPYVKVIREPENTENVQQSGNQDDAQGDEASADVDGYHWKCNVCEYKCAYKVEMGTHALNVHEEKGQFKCNTCSYKTNNKMSFEQHLNAKHPYDLNAESSLIYQKMKGGLKKAVATAEGAEINNLDEPFDTTPLWRRDMPRVRHIRGILFEDEKPEGKSNKRKSDVEPSPKPAKIKPGKSTASDTPSVDKESDSLCNETVSSESSKVDSTLDIAESFREAEPGSSTFTTVDIDKLIRKFGPLGSPIAIFYRCTICQTFKTKYKHDMRDHLYRDLKYWRFRCKVCGYMGVNKKASLKHFERVHEPRQPTAKEQTILPPDHELETWVQALLKSQSNQMRGFSTSSDGNSLQDVKVRKNISSNARRSSMESLSSPMKDGSKKGKTLDSPQKITEGKKKTSSKNDENSSTNEIVIDIESNDSNDFDALAIDNKEGFDEDDFPDETSSAGELKITAKLPITCKYCNTKLSTLRGFKLHIEIRHLRRRRLQCVYCDTSLNSEQNMLKHLRVVHSGEMPTIQKNPEANPSELTTEFWEKEYKFMTREKGKKRKRNEEAAPAVDIYEKTPGVYHVCNKCGFRAINHFGLTVHMRRHATSKNFKCAYCSYAASTQSELWQHSELNHSNLDWKVGNGDLNTVDKSEIMKNTMTSKDRLSENYDEEAASTSGISGSFIVAKSDMMYTCFYCDSGNSTLDGVEEHWNLMHKGTLSLPFRYKEIPFDSAKNTLRCGYCPKRGTAAQIRLHSRKKHAGKAVKFVEIPIVPIAWVCQWCEDVCDNENQKKFHHNLFHSHKVPNFKRQEINTKGSPAHECPECPFKATSRPAMEKHLEKHVDSVICKRCDKTFRDVSIGILHNTQAHPGEVSKIEGFKTNVEKMMARVKWCNDVNQDRNTFETVARSALENTWKHCGVAKKSTTKSIIPVRPEPKCIKAVARKSTNPLPRYPPGTRFLIPEDSYEAVKIERNISYYGKPIVPVNLNNISTYMTLSGGRRMKVTCSSLAQFIDIEPSVIVKDLKHKVK